MVGGKEVGGDDARGAGNAETLHDGELFFMISHVVRMQIDCGVPGQCSRNVATSLLDGLGHSMA